MEMICLALLATGKYSKVIAPILGMTDHAVDFYERKIREKLNATHRTEAIHKALCKQFLTYHYPT